MTNHVAELAFLQFRKVKPLFQVFSVVVYIGSQNAKRYFDGG